MYTTWKKLFLFAFLLALPGSAYSAAETSTAGNEETAHPAAVAKLGDEANTENSKLPEKSAAAGYGAEIEELRLLIGQQSKQLDAQQQLLRQQQEQISALGEELRSTRKENVPGSDTTPEIPAVPSMAAAVSANSYPQDSDLSARIGKLERDFTSGQKETSQAIKALGAVKFSGDIRLRYEPFFGGGPANGAANQDRNRARYRLRFNATTKLYDDFTAGFSLASGDLGDPISTNSTETGFFTRKPIAIDKVFVAYNPHYFRPFTVTGGKFAYTWQNTELTWDKDLNPEGVSEQVKWDWNDHFLSHFALVAFQLPAFEIANGPDSGIFGGQIQTEWKILPRVRLAADAAYYDYRNPNTIAQNQTNGNGSATQGIPTSGGGTFGFSAATLTNNFGVIGGGRQFASKFGILDTLLKADVDTGSARWPVYVLLNYADNTRTCENTRAFQAAAVSITCDPHQRHAYWAEAQLGQTKNPGDLRFNYTFMRIERDAVVSAFNFSEIRQPTNVAQHRVEAYYQAYKNVTLGFTGYIGRQLVTAQSPNLERYLKRLQFDVIYSF
jgi:hypothetical protein